MPIYRKEGTIPAKRHVVFRQPNGNLYHEELFGTEGFSGMSSLVYHLNPPTIVKSFGTPYSVKPKIAVEDNLQARSYQSFKTTPIDDYINSRKTLFVNADMSIGVLCTYWRTIIAYKFVVKITINQTSFGVIV